MELHYLSIQPGKFLFHSGISNKHKPNLFFDLQPTFSRSASCNLPIIEVVQEFNRHRYRYRLAHGFTPLPWCTRFSPHLDNSKRLAIANKPKHRILISCSYPLVYTTLQLTDSDDFDGRNAQTTLALEEIFEDNQIVNFCHIF